MMLFSAGVSTQSFGDEAVTHAPKEKGEQNHDEHKDHEEEDHGKEEAGHDHKEDSKDKHAHEEGEKGGHGHDEGGAAIGPDKGIMEKGPLGIKLSPEAIKTISSTAIQWNGENLTIPYKALIRIKDTKSIFRLRDGWYKRTPVTVLSRQGESVTLRAEGLQTGDQIVISNVGFLRIAEVITEEGAAHSH